VWDDLNGDGVMDAGEPGLAAAILRLYAGDDLGKLIRLPYVTQADGAFHFDDLDAGRYCVTEENPTGYFSTTSDVMYVWVFGGTTSPANFGDWIPRTATPTATIHQPFKVYIPAIRKDGL